MPNPQREPSVTEMLRVMFTEGEYGYFKEGLERYGRPPTIDEMKEIYESGVDVVSKYGSDEYKQYIKDLDKNLGLDVDADVKDVDTDVDTDVKDVDVGTDTIVDTPGGKVDSTKVDNTYVDPDGWTLTNRFMISSRKKGGMFQIKDSKTGKVHKYPSLESANIGIKTIWAQDKPTQSKNETFKSIHRLINDDYSDDDIGKNEKRADQIYLANKLKDPNFLPEDLTNVEKEIEYPVNITQERHKASYRLSNPGLIKGYEGSALQKLDIELVGDDLPQFKTDIQYEEEVNNLQSSIDLWQEEIDSMPPKMTPTNYPGLVSRRTTLKKKILDAKKTLNELNRERANPRASIEPVTPDNDPLGLFGNE
jgi:hypothetical protein